MESSYHVAVKSVNLAKSRWWRFKLDEHTGAGGGGAVGGVLMCFTGLFVMF